MGNNACIGTTFKGKPIFMKGMNLSADAVFFFEYQHIDTFLLKRISSGKPRKACSDNDCVGRMICHLYVLMFFEGIKKCQK